MPELPEVDVVRRGLQEHVRGRCITDAEILGARVARRHPGGPEDLAAQLSGALVAEVDRRGKYLWLVLQHPDLRDAAPEPGTALALVVHLGMSGQLLVAEPDAPDQRHLHARVRFDDDGPQLRFVDQRTFGGLTLAELWPDPFTRPGVPAAHPFGVPEIVRHIAPDPWEGVFDVRGVARRIRARSSGIKRCLLDQGVVSGIGNIYADEALWRARVHGERPADRLTGPAVVRVLDHAADVMREAAAVGGTSFDTLYVNVNGSSGWFDRRLRVYGQEGRPCERCGALVRREAFMNRSSYYCPRCQPRPRPARVGTRS